MIGTTNGIWFWRRCLNRGPVGDFPNFSDILAHKKGRHFCRPSLLEIRK